MTERQRPQRIEWIGPEGWKVWADEDGCHVRSRSGDVLESCDVQRLVDIWAGARTDFTDDAPLYFPKPPTRDEMRARGLGHSEEYAKRRAMRAIESEFGATPSPATPF